MPALPPVTRAILPASLLVIVIPSHRDPLCRAGRHIRQEGAETLRHRRMRNNGIAERRIWETRQHGRLHDGHDLTSLGTYHREAENAVVAPNKGLDEPLRFVGRLRSQYSAHRQPRDARGNGFAWRLAPAPPDASWGGGGGNSGG